MSSEQQETIIQSTVMENCAAILVDVAGTTTALNFVQETLFPFVKEQVDDFLKTNWDKDDVKDAIKLLKKSDNNDAAAKEDATTTTKVLSLDEAIELIKTLTDKQDNNAGLKTLQGMIYKNGYENGKLKGHVFEDVSESFESWSKIGKKIAIYSTGSIESQQLLFSHTIKGDLTKFITKYYDQTVIGLKTDCESYQKIAKDLEIKPNEIVFISDNLNEVKAAKSAAFNALLIHRDGNEKIPETDRKDFTTITSFKELNFESTTKRKSDENETTVAEEPPTKIPKTEINAEKSELKTDNDKDEIKEDNKVEKMVEDEVVVEEQKEDKQEVVEKTTDDKTAEKKIECDKKKETEDVEISVKQKDESSTKTVNDDDKKVDDVEKKPVVKNNEEKEATVEQKEKTVEEKQTTPTVDEDKTTNDETTKATTEEKENKNVLANGVDNKEDGNKMEVVEEQQTPAVVEAAPKDNGTVETKEKIDDKETTTTTTVKTDEDTENTIKKLDETTKSPAAVSVEV